MNKVRNYVYVLILSCVIFALGGCGKVTMESLMAETIANLDQKTGMRSMLMLDYQDAQQSLEMQIRHQMMFTTVDSYGEVHTVVTSGTVADTKDYEVYTERAEDGLWRYVGSEGEWYRNKIDLPVDFLNTHISAILETLKAENFGTTLAEGTEYYDGTECYVLRARVDGEALAALQQRIWDFALSTVGSLNLPKDWMASEPLDMEIYIDQKQRLISGIVLWNSQCRMEMVSEGYDNVSSEDVAVPKSIQSMVGWQETEHKEEETEAAMDEAGNFILASNEDEASPVTICPPASAEYTRSGLDFVSFEQDGLTMTYGLHEGLTEYEIWQTVGDLSYLQAEDMTDYTEVVIDAPASIVTEMGTIHYVKAQYTYQNVYRGVLTEAWIEARPGVYVSLELEEFMEAGENSCIDETLITALCQEIKNTEI